MKIAISLACRVLSQLGVLSELGLKSLAIEDIVTATGILQSLHLRGCSLGEEAFEALGIGLSSCSTLKELRFARLFPRCISGTSS